MITVIDSSEPRLYQKPCTFPVRDLQPGDEIQLPYGQWFRLVSIEFWSRTKDITLTYTHRDPYARGTRSYSLEWNATIKARLPREYEP